MRWWLSALVVLAIVGAVAAFRWAPQLLGRVAPPIRVGILHSQTGPLAATERSIIDAEVLALEEINARPDGLLGRRVEWVIADGKSDPRVFAESARRLIEEEKVSVIFGCGVSAARRTVLPILEKADHLLFFPLAYEGLEQSPNIVYTGAAPNQQIIPTLKWAHDKLRARKFYLVGTDSIYSHGLGAIVKDLIGSLRAEVVGDEYIPLGGAGVDGAVAGIQRAKPDVVICSLVGETNVPFFRRLRGAGIRPEQCPVISYPLTEDDLQAFDASDVVGDYLTVSYAQSLKTAANLEFVRRFQARFGDGRPTGDSIDAAYNGVRLWAQAVEEAESERPGTVRRFLGRQSLDAPEGIISIDAATQHTWRPSFIGRIRPDKQLDIVWTSQTPIRPDPFPWSRSRAEWLTFLDGLYQSWGGHWINPRR
jgi:urea transport system substrate-binding protein